ncbi:MAG TPA: histidine kinase dimerization/phosphoacceptor domain -containing protein [Steroidobacteraceae bacterium]|nr:histidine kinase dimerization/phosphoacceptor domain -containing protein [Steroidobacteraceae bacterium]
MQEKPETILNCNDNEPGRYATTRILHRAGFKVIEVSTGTEALQVAREDLPPLVILDINLPDMSGVEVCRRLKADPATASTMVLQMSATNIAVADRVHSLAAGADSFLVEPVEPEELEAVSKALLRLHRSEAALRRALAERDLLLKEVNHRVKNSLQLVLSMLSLQGHRFKEPETRDLFTKAISRVTAIAAIHERLYQDQDPLTVEMHTYLTGLCAELVRASGMEENAQASLQIEVEEVRLPTEHGVAVALIVNELVMNALKHAQPASGPTVISVRLMRHGTGQVRLTVADNGEAPEQSSGEVAGLGTQLIRMLARQLNGTVTLERSVGFYAVHVTFPLQSAVSWRPPY